MPKEYPLHAPLPCATSRLGGRYFPERLRRFLHLGWLRACSESSSGPSTVCVCVCVFGGGELGEHKTWYMCLGEAARFWNWQLGAGGKVGYTWAQNQRTQEAAKAPYPSFDCGSFEARNATRIGDLSPKQVSQCSDTIATEGSGNIEGISGPALTAAGYLDSQKLFTHGF